MRVASYVTWIEVWLLSEMNNGLKVHFVAYISYFCNAK